MYSTFFLGTLYLEHVRHYSALQTGAAFLPWTITVGDPLARNHHAAGRAFGQLPVLVAGMTSARRADPVQHRRSQTAFFPTVFMACFAIGFGIGTAFMPLLTIAMADVPAGRCRAGVGQDHQRVAADQRRCRAGGAEHLWPSTHTKSLIARPSGGHYQCTDRGSTRRPSSSAPPLISVGLALALILLLLPLG